MGSLKSMLTIKKELPHFVRVFPRYGSIAEVEGCRWEFIIRADLLQILRNYAGRDSILR
jgi:hypothetical protein